jgi:HK97 family phage major capsid protein
MKENADKIQVKSEDRLTRLLDNVEKLTGKLEELDGLSENYGSLASAMDEHTARLKVLEDKRSGAARLYESPFATDQERRRELSRWVVDCYGSDFIRGYKPISQVWAERATNDVQTGGVDEDGGFTVPDLVAPEILRVIQSYGRGRELCRPFPMGSDVVKVPVRDTSGGKGVQVSWVGEATAPTEDKEEFVQATLNAKRLVGLTQISRELEQDSAVDFASYLMDVFGEAIAREEDTQVFVATTPFQGIYTSTAIATVRTAASTFASLSYDDVVELENAVDENLIDVGTFIVNAKTLKYVRKLKDQNDNPIWAPLAAGQPATILGRPYRIVNVMNKTDGADKVIMGYGDHRYFLFGTRNAQTVAFSDEAGFKTGSRWMRVMERIGLVLGVSDAFAVLKTKAS